MKTIQLIRVLCVLIMATMPTSLYAIDIRGDLEEKCSDGREHILIYGPNEVVDVTLDSDMRKVNWNVEKLKEMCLRETKLIVAHCHIEDNIFSSFPTCDLEEDGSDIGLALEVEYQCASLPSSNKTEIAHILYDIPGDTLVAYGLGLDVKRQIIKLANRARKADEKMNESTMQSLLLNIGNIANEFKNISVEFSEARNSLNNVYRKVFLDYVSKKCPNPNITEDLENCEGTSLEEFAWRASESQSEFFVTPYSDNNVPLVKIALPDSSVDDHININLSLCPNARNVTSENFGELVATGQVVIINCGKKLGLNLDNCELALESAKGLAAECSGLKIGVVNTDLYPELAKRDMLHDDRDIPGVKIYSEGWRTLLDIPPGYSLKSIGMVLCGFRL